MIIMIKKKTFLAGLNSGVWLWTIYRVWLRKQMYDRIETSEPAVCLECLYIRYHVCMSVEVSQFGMIFEDLL